MRQCSWHTGGCTARVCETARKACVTFKLTAGIFCNRIEKLKPRPNLEVGPIQKGSDSLVSCAVALAFALHMYVANLFICTNSVDYSFYSMQLPTGVYPAQSMSLFGSK